MAAVHEKLLIVGSGAAGLTAAIYAARAGLEPMVLEGIQPGGQLTITTEVENYPGFAETIQGPWLMDQMKAQAEKVGTKVERDIIVSVDFSKRPFSLTGDSGTEYTADSVIIATGAQAKWLGLEGETKFAGRGISACATCDGFFYKNKEVIVVGGGNTAAEEALYLANICEKVTLVHRRDSLRAEKILQDRLFNHAKIEIIWDHELEEILGDDMGVTGGRLKSTKDGSTQDVEVMGIFVAIGHSPATEPFKGAIDIDKAGYITAPPGTVNTTVEGVFAAGDCVDHVYRQAVTAAGMGCMAALDAERFLSAQSVA